MHHASHSSRSHAAAQRHRRHVAAVSSAATRSNARVRWSSTATPLKLTLKVLVTRAKLDQRIIAGRSSPPAAALELRVRQLTSSRAQWRTARNLRSAVKHVDRLGNRPDFSAVVIDRRAVRAGRESILGLAERLERGAPVEARGMALATRFLTDGANSPLFHEAPERTVAQAIWEISDALGPEGPRQELAPVVC
jgi:hypothetical protein